MQGIGRNDSGMAGTQAPSTAADRQFQFAFDDFVNFFLGMGMLMDRRARIELVMRKCHAGRIEIAASPTRQAFDSFQLVRIDECHVPLTRGGQLKKSVEFLGGVDAHDKLLQFLALILANDIAAKCCELYCDFFLGHWIARIALGHIDPRGM
jgi:hypothetical protein